jgi:hypothetical protein
MYMAAANEMSSKPLFEVPPLSEVIAQYKAYMEA